MSATQENLELDAELMIKAERLIFSPELRLMLACAVHDGVRSKAGDIHRYCSQPLDWDFFLRLADHHRVYPLVYRALKQTEAEIPQSVMDALQERCKGNAFQAMRMAGETVRITQCLAAAGIRSVVLKGPPLAQTLYGDVTLRPSHDLDLLVRPEDLAKAGGMLEEQGYRRIHPDLPLTPRRLRYFLEKGHHFTYRHPQWRILLELHWRLNPCDVQLAFPDDRRIAGGSLAGGEVPVLAAEEELLFLILHGVQHGWFRLRWLCDIGELIHRKLDWKKVMELAQAKGIVSLVHQALLLVDEVLALPVPEPLLRSAEADPRAKLLAEMVVPFLQSADYEPHSSRMRDWELFARQKKYDVAIRSGMGIRRGYIIKHFGPTEEDIRRFELPDALFGLYYAIRPFTWAERHLFKQGKDTKRG